MKNVLIFVALLLVAVVGLGVWQGWFTAKKADGSVTLGVDKAEFTKDKEAAKKWAGDKYGALKTKLAGLRGKSTNLTADAKKKAEEEHDALAKKIEAQEAKIKSLEVEADKTKFDEAKKLAEKELEELEKLLEKP